MPSEPAESNFKNKVHATAYPTHERNGVIWAYMGPREVPPPLPQIEAQRWSTGRRHGSRSSIGRATGCRAGKARWTPSTPPSCTSAPRKAEDSEPGTFNFYQCHERSPKFSVIDTDFGTSYGAYRPAEDDTYYWRIAHMMFPFYAMIPAGWLARDRRLRADGRRPHDALGDPGATRRSGGRCGSDRPAAVRAAPGARRGQAVTAGAARSVGTQAGTMGPDDLAAQHARTGTAASTSTRRMANDYLIDREAQRQWKSYTGIRGIRQQDMAVTESMGTIYDRTHEHLGTTDALIIRTRRKLIAGGEGAARPRHHCRPASTTRRCTTSAPASSSCRAASTGGTPCEAPRAVRCGRGANTG